MSTDSPERTIEVPGYQGRAIEVRQGRRIRITDVEGCQIGDLFLIGLDDPHEIFSPARTRLVNFTPFPRVGQAFISSRRRPMLTFLEDASPGMHDMTFAPCDPEFYRQLGAGDGHPSCRSNFERAMQALGRAIAIYPDPVNLFQNTPVDVNGDYIIGKTLSGPGDYVEFRAEMDLIVALTACSTDVRIEGVDPIGGRSTPLRIEVFLG
jgi:uncharacterized protein YcgI (DUF1989 family)